MLTSRCYLAAGKPVLVQDTGFGDHLAVGWGVLSLATVEQAMRGVEDIRRNYSLHAQAARGSPAITSQPRRCSTNS
ncbi:MAG TPA: hypothetical protein VFU31_05180 [Candidatus Binatia bacterium]|nr:hypothetical protein [Candidatus Binatia bacterium]